MRRVIITGVGGSVGHSLAILLQNKYDVIGIYRNHKPIGIECELIQADLSRKELKIEQVDTIIHAAASIAGNAIEMIEDNVVATMNLVRYAEKTKIQRFIYLSSVSAYGNVRGVLKVNSDIVNPEIYGCTKYIAEKVVQSSIIPQTMIIGLPRMLGPFVEIRKRKESGFLFMVDKILNDKNVECYIPNCRYNNFMHVNDLAAFISTIMEKEMVECKVLLGAEEPLTMLELLTIMKLYANSTSKIIIKENGSMPACAHISIERAKMIGYKPMSVKETLSTFIHEQREK